MLRIFQHGKKKTLLISNPDFLSVYQFIEDKTGICAERKPAGAHSSLTKAQPL